MRSASSTWKLVLHATLLAGIGCAALSWIVLGAAAEREPARALDALRIRARTLAALLGHHWRSFEQPIIQEALGAVRDDSIDIVVAQIDGAVIMDERGGGPRGPAPIADLRQVLTAGEVRAVRYWGPGERPCPVVAVRIESDGQPVGALWVAQPGWVADSGPVLGPVRLSLIAGLAALLAAAIVGLALRVRRDVFHDVIDAARQLSDSTPPPPRAARGADVMLAAVLDELRQRLSTQVDLIDRQRRMLADLVNQLREGVIVVRGDGRVALINPTAARLLGLSLPPGGVEALYGKPVEACIPQHAIQQLLAAPPRQPAQDSGPAAPAASGPAEPPEPSVRLEVQSRSGTVHLLVRTFDVVLAESEGAATTGGLGRVAVLTDITALQRTFQMRTDFVANASHELRTPLSTIRAAVETLMSMDLRTEAPAAQQFLAKVDRQSMRMQQMVSDLLDLSRLESPTQRFAPETLECRRILADLTARFADAVERRGLTWEARSEPPDVVTMRANAQLLRLVLDNLVDNAIKFTDAGGRVAVVLRHASDVTEVAVSDTGCGIPPEEQERVFERFYQVHRARSGGVERGTGLGLSIVRHAVGAMGGSIALASEPGKGTTVTVRLPRNQARDELSARGAAIAR